jgi:hypothetical protein
MILQTLYNAKPEQRGRRREIKDAGHGFVLAKAISGMSQ